MSLLRRSPTLTSLALVMACGAALTAACGTSSEVVAHNAKPVAGGDQSQTTDQTDTTDQSQTTDQTNTTDQSQTTDQTSATDQTNTTDGGDPQAAFGWKSCGDNLECGHLQVPLDYANPSGDKITLFVERHLATDQKNKIGSLLVNPGGPGFGGAVLAEQADSIYGASLLEKFDIVAWDPRGAGESEPHVDCITDYDKYFGIDQLPDNAAEKAKIVEASQGFDDACEQKNAALLPHISTRESATDMDSIRKALGEDKISYFGFSYGSELGATWATMFPDTVRSAVLDGAVNPKDGYLQEGLNQAKGFEASLDKFLAQCSTDSKCAFHNGGDSAAAYDALVQQINAKPIEVSPDRTPVTTGVLYTATSEAMYLEQFWPELAKALASAQKGDGKGLLDLYDQYYQRNPDGTYDNSLEAFQAISCLDDPGPKSVAAVDAAAPQFLKVAPRLGPSFAYAYQCALWPVPPAQKVAVTGKGAGPIVVVGTTGDPATPLASTKGMADSLEDGVLVTVVANQHTGYGLNDCINSAVDDYLVDLTVPQAGLVCK